MYCQKINTRSCGPSCCFLCVFWYFSVFWRPRAYLSRSLCYTSAAGEEVRIKMGLDKPFYIQYFVFLKNALRGDFGLSYVAQTPVIGLILERLPASIELAISAMLIALIFGIGLGVLVSLNPRYFINRLIMAGSLFGISLPTFLIGILLIMIFAVKLGFLPTFGRGEVIKIAGNWRTGFFTIDGLRHLILPASTLGIYQLAVLLRLTRGGMLEVLREDYIRTAWAKGLPPKIIIFKHALRNAPMAWSRKFITNSSIRNRPSGYSCLRNDYFYSYSRGKSCCGHSIWVYQP